jgi:hypothetical protein
MSRVKRGPHSQTAMPTIFCASGSMVTCSVHCSYSQRRRTGATRTTERNRKAVCLNMNVSCYNEGHTFKQPWINTCRALWATASASMVTIRNCSALDCGERLACQANTTHTLYTARLLCALRISLFPDRLPLIAGGIRIRAYRRDRILCAGLQNQL